MATSLPCPHMVDRVKTVLWCLLTKALIPSLRPHPDDSCKPDTIQSIQHTMSICGFRYAQHTTKHFREAQFGLSPHQGLFNPIPLGLTSQNVCTHLKLAHLKVRAYFCLCFCFLQTSFNSPAFFILVMKLKAHLKMFTLSNKYLLYNSFMTGILWSSREKQPCPHGAHISAKGAVAEKQSDTLTDCDQ